MAVVIATLTLSHAQIATACTPVRYEADFSSAGLIEQMVANAATIQVMRATRREFAWRYEYDAYPPVYAFHLEPVETLKGWDLGRLRVHGYLRGAEEHDWADVNEQLKDEASREGRRWEDQDLIDIFQSYVEPRPPPDSPACAIAYSLQVGQTYLVFRDQQGALLVQSIRGASYMQRRLAGPAIMAVSGRGDPWLRAVHAEVRQAW